MQRLKPIFFAVLAVVLIGLFCKSISDSTTHQVEAKLTTEAWAMRVSIETIQPVKYSNEPVSSPPSGAYNSYCWSETDLGDEDTPDVTNYYCDYTIDEWRHFRYGEAFAYDFVPTWKQPVLNPGERINNSTFSEYYELKFEDASGNIYTYNPDNIGEFQSFNGATDVALSVTKKGEVAGYRFYNQP